MSRLAKANPELNEQELEELAMRGTPKPINERPYDFTCYKCGDNYKVDKETHDWLESLERSPKCGHCYL